MGGPTAPEVDAIGAERHVPHQRGGIVHLGCDPYGLLDDERFGGAELLERRIPGHRSGGPVDPRRRRVPIHLSDLTVVWVPVIEGHGK